MAKKIVQKKGYDQYHEFGDGERGPATSATARALAILHAISSTDGSVSAVELSPKLGLPKPTVHRLMQVLEYIGYLQREPGSKRFILGNMQTEMALQTLINSPQRALRHTILRSLVDEVRETCNITTLAGDSIVYVDRVEAEWPLRTHFRQGSRVPIHCSASGKLYLSMMPAHKRRRLLTAVPLKKFTENTQTNAADIEKDLKIIRSAKVSLDREEFLQGLIGMAVPIFDPKGRMCATVSISVPTVRATEKEVLAHVPALNRTALALAQTLKA
jgi:IclR family acetate operon transcriptional repressor